MLVARDTEKDGTIRKGIGALGLCWERVNPRVKVSRGPATSGPVLSRAEVPHRVWPQST